ncbi:MAG: hypothetical protein ABIH00_03815 [Armatimonadota bacterium]
MKRKFIASMMLFLAVILMFLRVSAAADEKTASPERQVTVAIKKGPSYVFHVMAVSKLGFDSDYAVIYKDTVVDEDKYFLQKYDELLTFKDGKCGDLVQIAVFFPAYINLETREDFKEYFSLLKKGFKVNDFTDFLTRYASFIEKLKVWPFKQNRIDNDYLKSLSKHRDIIYEMEDIYLRNYGVYYQRLWEVEKGKMFDVAKIINDRLKHSKYENLIFKWEKTTGKKFKTDDYYIILSRAIKNGPSAISLGYDQNVLFYDFSYELMMKYISHETGAHILIDIFADMIKKGDYSFAEVYNAYECLAAFYNSKILNTSVYYLPSSYEPGEYESIYSKLYNENPGISPEALLTKGLNIFLSSKKSVSE